MARHVIPSFRSDHHWEPLGWVHLPCETIWLGPIILRYFEYIIVFFFPFFWASKDHQKDPEMMESPNPQPLPVPHQAWQSAGQRDHLQGRISTRLREEQQRNLFFFWISLMCCISTHINLYQSISTHINPLPGLEDGGGEWRLSPWNSADGFPGRSYFGKPRGAHSHQLLGRNKEGVQPGVIASTSIWNGSGRPLNWQLLFEKIVEYLLSYI